MRRGCAWLAIAATLGMCACAPAGGSPAPASAPTQTPAASNPAPTPGPPLGNLAPGTASNSDAQPSIDAALREASAYLGVSQANLKVDKVEPRDWGDTSLGCPRQGVMYAQVVTPGYLINVSASVSGTSKQLEYHSDARGRVVLCQER